MTQSASAFGSIQDGLSFFRNAYDQFAGYRAAIIRLHGLVVANEEGRALPEVTTTPCVDGTVELDDVEVRTPDGKQLIKPLDMRLEIGDTLVITGPSGSGKTTLLRSLAELWPFCSGTLTRPCGPNETMFLSQLPYVPLGDLRAVVTYPGKEGTIDDDTLKRMLQKVALPHLVDRLDEVQDWAKVLSPGEQQRIAFARILLTKPKVVFCDEATSALDEGLEFMLYQAGAHGAAGHHSGQRQPPHNRRAASHPRTRAARRRRMATRPSGGRTGARLWCNAAPGSFPAWKRSRRPWTGATS